MGFLLPTSGTRPAKRESIWMPAATPSRRSAKPPDQPKIAAVFSKEKHKAQWRTIGDQDVVWLRLLPNEDIEKEHVLDVLKPIGLAY